MPERIVEMVFTHGTSAEAIVESLRKATAST